MDPECCTLEQLALIGVDPAGLTAAWLFGAGSIFTFWVLGIAAGWAIKAIKTL